jgi:hypothetical protein
MFLILSIVQAIQSNIAAGTLTQIKKNITCVLNIMTISLLLFSFSKLSPMDGDTKKRPGQPETARSSPGTGNNARRIGILFNSNFCRNYNGI